MKMIKQMIRGMRDLPHVGPHPGTDMLIMFILLGVIAGAKGGFFGAVGGAFIMGLFVLPLYLFGAYDRANISDRLQKSTEE